MKLHRFAVALAAANVISLQACVGRWQSVICAESSHIHNDEGGAPEVMAGIKLWTIPTADGKLTPELIKPQLARLGNLHQSQPAVISISNTTELGTVYRASEIAAIAASNACIPVLNSSPDTLPETESTPSIRASA